MSDAPRHDGQGSRVGDADSAIQEAARFLARQRDVSTSTALRLMRDTALESGRFIGDVARDITGGLSINDRSP